VMIRLGRVHGGLMVDVQAINAKLVRRSEMILRRLTGRSSEDIAEALRSAHGSVKLAVLLLHGCSPDEAARLLEQCGGRLRSALRAIGVRESAVTSAADVPTVADEAPAAPHSDVTADINRR
jgi:N-acetylmuramic acid 6-phosphate etherase